MAARSLLILACCAGALHAQSATEDALADRFFGAWSLEYLDLDAAAGRKAWAEVARDGRFRRGDRNIALGRLVQLSRLSGSFDELRDVTRALTIDKALDPNSRAQLFVYLDLVRQRRPAVFDEVPELVERYRKAKRRIGASPSKAASRAKARAELFRELRKLVERTRPPVVALMPDLSRFPTRSILSSSPSRPSDLNKLIEELRVLEREIRELRRERARPAEIAKRVRQRDLKKRILKRRASRRLSDWRAEIAVYEEDGKHEAVESIVELCLPLERLWPQRARSYSLVEALEDPVYRRGALVELRDSVRAQLPQLASEQAERASAMRKWLDQVAELRKRGDYHGAARASLALLTAYPELVPEGARRR